MFGWATMAMTVAMTVAWADVAVPPLSAHVVDLTGTLTADEITRLDQRLQQFEARKGTQLAVLIVPTTAPETIEQYALRVAEQWKLGRKKIDDGALLVVAKDDRKLRIEVGYGLEGALNDATTKRIIDDIITPRFKAGDFAGGIGNGLDRVIRVADGEPLPPPRPQSSASFDDLGQLVPVLIILALVLGGILRAIFGPLLGAMATGGGVALIAWALVGVLSIATVAGIIAFFVTLLGGGLGMGRGGGVYLPGGRGGGFGGGSGGGFSGDGGSFGGGGASGSW
jgi:uncharacterized protein